MELVLSRGIWGAEISKHMDAPAGASAGWGCAAPGTLVTELCINLTHSLNPDLYKYITNTNRSPLQEYNLSLLYMPKQRMCFVTRAGYTWASSRSEMMAQIKFLGTNHRPWNKYIPLICRGSMEQTESWYCTVPSGITGCKPLWIKPWVINPAGSQSHLPFSKPASSMPFALHRRVPTECNWVWSFIRSGAACGRSNGNCSQK